MRLISTVVAIAALMLMGASAPGAMTNKQPAVPAILKPWSLWNAFVTVSVNGVTSRGYASWTGGPDVVTTADPRTLVAVGDGLSFRVLTVAEQRAAVVTVELIDTAWGNGIWNPKATVTGMR